MSTPEQSLIGACILDPQLAGTLSLKPEYFLDPLCAEVWEAIRGGAEDHVAIMHTVGNENEAHLAFLVSNAYTAGYIKAAKAVERDWRKREFEFALVAAKSNLDRGKDIDLIINQLMKSTVETGDSGFENIAGLANAAYQVMESGDHSKFIPTGYRDIDAFTGGLERKNLTIIAGRPSMGKTALALGICKRAAVNHQVSISSIEMDKESLTFRMMSLESQMDLRLLRTGSIKSKLAWSKAAKAVESLSDLKLYIDDNQDRTASQIAAQGRRQKMKHGLDVLLIDYLGLLNPEDARKKKNEQIGDMTRLFKKLAKELDCAVVLLCQLNRDAEGEIPTMSHLKDSGDVEQDADLIIFPRIFKDPSGIECAEAIIGKNRNGPKGTAGLIWQGETASYESIPNMAI